MSKNWNKVWVLLSLLGSNLDSILNIFHKVFSTIFFCFNIRCYVTAVLTPTPPLSHVVKHFSLFEVWRKYWMVPLDMGYLLSCSAGENTMTTICCKNRRIPWNFFIWNLCNESANFYSSTKILNWLNNTLSNQNLKVQVYFC